MGLASILIYEKNVFTPDQFTTKNGQKKMYFQIPSRKLEILKTWRKFTKYQRPACIFRDSKYVQYMNYYFWFYIISCYDISDKDI